MRLLVVGAGGHAKVVIDTAEAAGYEIAGVIGSAEGVTEILGHHVSTDPAEISADCFICATGDNARRAADFKHYMALGYVPAMVAHPSAVISDRARIGAGTFVAAGVIVNACAQIGENAILNTGCTIDHDVVIGPHVLVGPGANLCGAAWVGPGVTVGTGTSVVPCARIGAWSVVGASAAVTHDLPNHSVCVGVPARVIRDIEVAE